MWTLLGLGREDTPIHLVSIDPSPQRAESLCAEAAAFLRTHGKTPQTHPIDSEADPADILRAQAKTLNARAIVMGAFGHTGLREMFFGSSTRTMLETCPVPMFIYH